MPPLLKTHEEEKNFKKEDRTDINLKSGKKKGKRAKSLKHQKMGARANQPSASEFEIKRGQKPLLATGGRKKEKKEVRRKKGGRPPKTGGADREKIQKDRMWGWVQVETSGQLSAL